MGAIIGVIKYLIYVAVLGTMVYARALYLELQKTKDKLKKSEETIATLEDELNALKFSKYDKE